MAERSKKRKRSINYPAASDGRLIVVIPDLIGNPGSRAKHWIPAYASMTVDPIGGGLKPSYAIFCSLRTFLKTCILAKNLNSRYCMLVHVISRKALQIFWRQHPDSKKPLSRWFKVMQKTTFGSFSELRTAFPTADIVRDLLVFNINGNKYRLIVSVHFNRGKAYIRHILTHQEYDRGDWKK